MEFVKDFPWRDVAATAIMAFLFWRVFLKLTEIIAARLDRIIDNTKEINRTLEEMVRNDLQHLSHAIDHIIELLEQLRSERGEVTVIEGGTGGDALA